MVAGVEMSLLMAKTDPEASARGHCHDPDKTGWGLDDSGCDREGEKYLILDIFLRLSQQHSPID